MEILIPGTTHIITWTKQNLQDTNTYYVKAVIRNARTNTTLGTVTLTDLGSSNRFSGEWIVPQDERGFGVEISIVKTIYEDSSYSTVSAVYGAWEDRYLIFDLASRSTPNGGGFGGQVVDYEAIARIVKKTVQAELQSLPKPEKQDLSTVVIEIDGKQASLLERIKTLFAQNKQKELDISPIVQSLKTIEKKQSALEKTISEIPNTVQSSVKQVEERMNNSVDERIVDAIADSVASFSDEIRSETSTAIKTLTEKVFDAVGKLDEKLEKPLEVMLRTSGKEEKKEAPEKPEMPEEEVLPKKDRATQRKEIIDRLTKYAR